MAKTTIVKSRGVISEELAIRHYGKKKGLEVRRELLQKEAERKEFEKLAKEYPELVKEERVPALLYSGGQKIHTYVTKQSIVVPVKEAAPSPDITETGDAYFVPQTIYPESIPYGTATTEQIMEAERVKTLRTEAAGALYEHLGKPVKTAFSTDFPGAPAHAKFMERVLTGVGAPLSMALGPPEIREKTFEYVAERPGKAVMELIGGLAAFPLIAGAEIVGELRKGDVGSALGSAAATGTVVGAVGGALVLTRGIYARAPKIRYEKIMSTTGDRVSFRGLHLEYGEGARTYPLVTLTEGKLIFGTPKADLTGRVFKGEVPVSTLQTKIILKSLGDVYPESEALKVKHFITTTEITAHTPSKFMQDSFGRGTVSLGPRGTREVLKFAKKESALIYGTYGAETQIPKGALGRRVVDIDIQLTSGQAAAGIKTHQLLGKLRGVGEDVMISPKSPTLIISRVGGREFHAVDIHVKDLVSGSPAGPVEGGFGFRLGQTPIKVRGIDIMPLSEHGIRKGVSSVTLRDGFVGPAAHRLKDIGDYITTQRVLIESRKMGPLSFLRARGTRKAEFSLSEFERLTGVKDGPPSKMSALIYTPDKPSMSMKDLFYRPSAPAGLSARVSLGLPSPSKYTAFERMFYPSVSAPSKMPSSVSAVLSGSPSMPKPLGYYYSGIISPSGPLSASGSIVSAAAYGPSMYPSFYSVSAAEITGGTYPRRVGFFAPPPLEGPGLVSRDMDISRDLFGRGYDYKLSLGGLISGTKIERAPKGKLAGLGIRYPVRSGKKKGRRDVSLSDLLGG